MPLETGDRAEKSKERAFAAANVEKRRRFLPRSGIDHVSEGSVHRVRMTQAGEPASCLGRFARISRMFRSPILRLKEIQEARAMLIERVVPHARPSSGIAFQPFPTTPDGASKDNGHELVP
jgi:hypothetical protein